MMSIGFKWIKYSQIEQKHSQWEQVEWEETVEGSCLFVESWLKDVCEDVMKRGKKSQEECGFMCT